jgi:hypothetical protein
VIVFGVTFISILFAAATSFLVAGDREELTAMQARQSAEVEATHAVLWT